MKKAAPAIQKQPETEETQPVDVMAAPTPAINETIISPDHSAESKRSLFQSKGADHTTTYTPQAMPAEPAQPPSKDEKKNEFTESDNEAGYFATL